MKPMVSSGPIAMGWTRINSNKSRIYSAASNAQLSSRRLNRADGFTLIELIVVIVLIAIMSATTAPVLFSLDSARVKAGAYQVLRDMQFARQRSVALGTRQWVVLDTDLETCSLFAEVVGNPGKANRIATTNEVDGGPFVTDLSTGMFSGGGLSTADIDGAAEVGFDFLGRSVASSEAMLQTDGTVTFIGGYSITIVAQTGHCYITDP